MQSDSEQASCSDNMIFGKIFAEIFEGSDRSRTSLDFIENNQGVSRNLAAGFDFQSPQNDFRIKRIFKQRANSLVSFEVEMNEILERRRLEEESESHVDVASYDTEDSD